ncbi:superfamily II DNA/RNA helicase [Corynebacterium renale]|nr:superfamily II DNA/RNA helicase [Corynebacterium renale]STC95578.1 superfamily II DNA/RNA helicase [Corynebacterium renale]
MLKLWWGGKKDSETGKSINDVAKMIYKKQVTTALVSADADEYMLGSRSTLAWIVNRYHVKKDKALGVVNDPKDWGW